MQNAYNNVNIRTNTLHLISGLTEMGKAAAGKVKYTISAGEADTRKCGLYIC